MSDQPTCKLSLEGPKGTMATKFHSNDNDKFYAIQLHEAMDALFRRETGFGLGPIILDTQSAKKMTREGQIAEILVTAGGSE